MNLKKTLIKGIITNKSLRDTSRIIFNVALKSEVLRDILCEVAVDASIVPKHSILGNFINNVKEQQIRKLFTSESYREGALDLIEMILENDFSRNLLLDTIDRKL